MEHDWDAATLSELRLFLEELCCNLLRFQHSFEDGVPPEQVRIQQEVYLGVPGAFADIRVTSPGRAPYFLEIKYGHPADRIVAKLERKYGPEAPGAREGSKLVVVVDEEGHAAWDEITARLGEALYPGLALEVWNEATLLSLLRDRFEIDAARITPDEVVDLRLSMEWAKGHHAFGDAWTGDAQQSSLLWHFGFWRLRQLSDSGRIHSREIMPPGVYRGAAVIFADLSAFSSYVRDTRDETVVRQALTSFYSKARYQVLNTGGMLYQFLGDGVLALFGVPEAQPTVLAAALECATALLDIGESVMHDWQRQIDHLQAAAGCHVGMAVGDLNVLSLRPFSRTHMGAIGEPINVAARLATAAAASEMVLSNALHQRLPTPLQGAFHELEPVDAKNVGRLQAWKLPVAEARRAISAFYAAPAPDETALVAARP